MGNAAAKLIDETVLVDGTVDAGKAIAKALVSSATMKIKNKNKTWVQYDGDTETSLWKSVSVGMIRKHSVIEDSAGKAIAVIIIEKKTMTGCTNFICRDVPSYEGQEPLTADEMSNAAIKEEYGALYKFSKMVCTRKMTTADCTYGLVTGPDTIEPLYEGEKLASMGFRALFKEVGGAVVAKAYMPGMSFSPHVDAASGVDLLAIVSIGYALVGDESSAGALAGAGVI